MSQISDRSLETLMSIRKVWELKSKICMDFLLTKKFTESVHFNEKNTFQSNIEVKLPQKYQKKSVFFSDSDVFYLKNPSTSRPPQRQFRYQATVAGRAWAMAVDAIGGSGNADENDI